MKPKQQKARPLADARVGIDIGRVILCPADDQGGPDTSFLSADDAEAMHIPPSTGAVDVIRRLVEKTEGRVWLVSKCGPRIQQRTRQWLARQSFFELTGIPPHHLHFCRERKDKAPIANRLGLTHFIDDRADVLSHLRGRGRRLYLFGAQRGPIPDWVCHVADWSAVARRLLSDDVSGSVAPSAPDRHAPARDTVG